MLIPIEPAKPQEQNWQLHCDTNNMLWAVPIVPGAKLSQFGNKQHLLRLLRQGTFDLNRLNEQGIALLSGLCHRIVGDPDTCYQNPKAHAFLAFA